LHGAIRRYREALELFARIGDTKLESNCWQDMGSAFLALGDLQEAELCVSRALDTNVGRKFRIAFSYVQIGLIALCRGHWEEAMDAFQKPVQIWREISERTGEGYAAYLLGRAYLAQEDRAEELKQFQKAVTLAGPEALRREPSSWFFFYFDLVRGLRIIPSAVSGLEEAYEDSEAFRFFCRRFQEERPVEDSAFVQWFLEPTDVGVHVAGGGHRGAKAPRLGVVALLIPGDICGEARG
jgi:tetratricopeptide (TPR) repeat protein